MLLAYLIVCLINQHTICAAPHTCININFILQTLLYYSYVNQIHIIYKG